MHGVRGVQLALGDMRVKKMTSGTGLPATNILGGQTVNTTCKTISFIPIWASPPEVFREHITAPSALDWHLRNGKGERQFLAQQGAGGRC